MPKQQPKQSSRQQQPQKIGMKARNPVQATIVSAAGADPNTSASGAYAPQDDTAGLPQPSTATGPGSADPGNSGPGSKPQPQPQKQPQQEPKPKK